MAKLYVSEPDSADFEAHAATSAKIVVSGTGRLELRSVLRRREAEGSIASGSAKRLHASFCALIATGQFCEEPITPELEAEFYDLLDVCLGHSPPIFLRTNDGLHLAAARRAGETEVVSTDKILRNAALHVGFTVFPS